MAERQVKYAAGHETLQHQTVMLVPLLSRGASRIERNVAASGFKVDIIVKVQIINVYTASYLSHIFACEILYILYILYSSM